ncbi:MAG TPA: zf-HC2 domain-containing protein [Thermoanaerobaculia bacterium]|nr:zf-HC2 domain-containing protein [Thermoanaerobaculia bacterium]
MVLDEPRSCPDPEILGAFLDGTLDAATRREVSAHVAECNHCLYVLREVGAHERDAPPVVQRWRRLPLVAGFVLAILTGTVVVVRHRGDPVRRMAAATHDAGVRTFEGRLAGFEHVRYTSTRSAGDANPLVREVATDVLKEDANPRSGAEWHASGIANLLVGRREQAVRDLAGAARLAPRSAEYRSDLAAARIALGTAQRDQDELRRGVADAEEALRLAPRLPEATFNRALALERLGDRNAARSAFEVYLALDPASSWAEEARWRLDRLSR